MIPHIFFVSGVISTSIIGYASYSQSGDDKRGAVALPFMFFAAAAVAKYIGL